MDQLINALPALVRAAGGAEEIIEAATLAAWNYVAGEGLRRQTVATSLNKQRLTVAVSDAVWQRQLESMSSQFLFRLNSLLGQNTVKFIEFRVAPQTITSRSKSKTVASSRNELHPISTELMSAAAAIRDPALRRSFLGAAGSCVRRRESPQD